jgi:hypothetical protein
VVRGIRVVAVTVALVGLVGACGGGDDDEGATPPTSAGDGGAARPDGLEPVPPADGCTGDRSVEVMTCRGLERNHVLEPPEYPFLPPVGGPHNPTVANCGLYDQEVPPEFGVHSIEHGAVWITYSTAVTPEELDRLAAMVAADPRLLVSGLNDAPAPFVLTAWGAQRYVTSLDDPAVPSFIEEFRDADTAPESGFACAGGAGAPIVVAG